MIKSVRQQRELERQEATVTIYITRPEVEALINERLRTGQFADAEDVILRALRSSDTDTPGFEAQRREAIERLKNFGTQHGLSLAGMTIRELRDETLP
jgi:hypothetical protein